MSERLGRYELLRHIGSGGMADVFLAQLQGAMGFTRQLVVKRMRKELQRNAEAVRMFLDEARLCSKLHHPQIVQVFDLGEADGSYFIAMEYVDGPHLGRLARDCWRAGTPPPAVLGAYVVHRAADGLHAAHETRDPETGEPLGIVHRDVTPHNILLSRFGDVKVADFGVAKTLARADTHTGVIKGKLAYLSPEQVRGEELDRRSDVFSLGIVLFEVLTGRRLFKDKSDIKTLQRITREDAPPPSRFNAEVDTDLDRVCLTALARDRERRYPTMRAFERALEGWITARETKHLKTALAQFVFRHGKLPPAPASRETPIPLVDGTGDPERTVVDPSGPRGGHEAETLFESRLTSTAGEGTALTRSGAWARNAPASGISLDTRRLQALKTNLSPQGTRFVGRAAELERIRDVLRQGARLVTLHGAAGTGKTRLALRFAEGEVRRLSLDGGGAWIADLTEARTVDGICTQVASALGVPLGAQGQGEDSAGVLARVLEGRGELLLVLDNFEQVVELGAETIGRWLKAAPALRVIVTSRELLRLPGEHTIEVAPLPLPEPGAHDEHAPSEAMALFLDRARAAAPDWQPGEADLDVIADIVRSLDGLPLAIELAAARIPVLKPRQLRERLTRRFELLRGGTRDARPRQATLKSALDWSWELLSPVEQHALAECSVFRGGFDLEAAEAVLDLAAFPSAPWVLDVLQALRDKSLLVATSAPDFPDEARFRTYESIREYAAEKLEQHGGRDEACARHVEHYLPRALAWAKDAHGHRGKPALARLRLEKQNLLAIHQRARETPRPTWATADHALVVALVTEPLYEARGPRQEQLALLDDALTAAGPEADPVRRARALAARGRARRRLGRVSESRHDFAEALRLARASGDAREEGRVLRDLGLLASDEARLEDARRNYLDALLRHRAAGDERDEAVTSAYLAFLCEERGELDEAARHFSAALARVRASGDRAFEALVLGNSASLEQELGQLDVARARYEEAIAILRDLGQPTFVGPFLGALASLLHEQGRVDEAIEHHERALASVRETGNLRYEGLMLAYLAAARADRGERDEAARLLERAARRAGEVGDPRHLACVRLCRGFLVAADARAAFDEDAHTRARRLLDELDALLDEATRPLPAGAAASDASSPDAARTSTSDTAAAGTSAANTSAADSSDEVRRVIRLLLRARAPLLDRADA